MTCDKCGAKNVSDARFCSNCGSELINGNMLECRSCGTRNEPDSSFCSYCGEQLTPHAAPAVRKPQRQQAPRTHIGRYVPAVRKRGYVALAITAVAVMIIVVIISGSPKSNSVTEGQVAVVETKLQDPVEESKAMQIAQKFDCSCGTCGDLSLDTCTCPTAIKEREFIRKSVEEGTGSDQIIAAVNKTYGHKKGETNLVVPPLSGFVGSSRINTNSGGN